MAKPSSDARSQAELRFDRTRKTTETAQALIDSELAAVRAKTKKLKAARLAQEAKAVAAEIEKKPKPKKKAAARKK
ncbi:MAG: hypothetical protein ACRED5_13155 [Propylenella sp.]